jgi:hypothetical protein
VSGGVFETKKKGASVTVMREQKNRRPHKATNRAMNSGPFMSGRNMVDSFTTDDAYFDSVIKVEWETRGRFWMHGLAGFRPSVHRWLGFVVNRNEWVPIIAMD